MACEVMCLIVVSLLVPAYARTIVVPPQPVSPYADTEVSTNIQFSASSEHAREIEMRFALDGCASNCIQVAFGRDADGDGVLGADGGGTNNVQMVIGPGGGLQPLDPYSTGGAYSDGLAIKIGDLDPFSYPEGSTNTVLEHIFYSGTTNGVFAYPQSSESMAVLQVSVSGSGTGDLIVGNQVVPLVAPPQLRSAPPNPAPPLLVQLVKGETYPIYFRGDELLPVPRPLDELRGRGVQVVPAAAHRLERNGLQQDGDLVRRQPRGRLSELRRRRRYACLFTQRRNLP